MKKLTCFFCYRDATEFLYGIQSCPKCLWRLDPKKYIKELPRDDHFNEPWWEIFRPKKNKRYKIEIEEITYPEEDLTWQECIEIT